MALAIVLVISNLVRAQTDPPAPETAEAQKKKETEQRQELEKKTLALLNDVASAAWSLKLPENRLYIISNTADLLWTVDEKRARNLYWEALNSINLITPSQPARNAGERVTKAEGETNLRGYMSTFRLRQSLLRRIAQRDSQLALEMLRATRQVAPQMFGSEFPIPDDRQLEQEIASEVAGRDPAHALQVARESLAKGFSFELFNLLYQLNQKDSEKASAFAGDIIAKLRTTNVAKDFRASSIGIRLLESSRIRDTTPARSAESPKPLTLNDEQKRDLVDVLTNAALNVSANSHLLYDISDVMPEIQEFFPERRSALERKILTFNETLTKQQRDQNTYNTLIRRGMPEEIVRVAASANDDDRDHLYRQAAIIASFRGSTESFRDFVSKEVNNEGEQRKLLDLLDNEEITLAALRKQVDQLKKLLPKIRRKEERARAMAEVALLLKEKGEDAEAATLLDEAATLIKTDLKSETHSNALLTLLCAYALIDPPKAFALAERTVDQANSQISFLMLVDKVVKSGAIKKSEIILNQGGIMSLNSMVFRYGKGVTALAKTDFNRTRALADRFDRNELRVLARLLIVKGLMGSAP